MLQSDDRKKVEEEIQNLAEKIKNSVRKAIQEGMSDEQLINKVVSVTVKKFTPESKMLLSSVCNILLNETLLQERYIDSKNKAFLYEKDIVSEINNNFIFDVPNNISYSNSKLNIEKLLISGLLVVSGGVISIPVKNAIPLAISVVIAAIMYYVLIKYDRKKKKTYDAICEYLDGVSATLLQWLDNVQEYYHNRINEIEKEMDANE